MFYQWSVTICNNLGHSLLLKDSKWKISKWNLFYLKGIYALISNRQRRNCRTIKCFYWMNFAIKTTLRDLIPFSRISTSGKSTRETATVPSKRKKMVPKQITSSMRMVKLFIIAKMIKFRWGKVNNSGPLQSNSYFSTFLSLLFLTLH